MNDDIRKARDAALDILKPSLKDLEHGMELHANALVCDGYGFSPRARYDEAALAALREEGASRTETEPLQMWMSTNAVMKDKQAREDFMEAWRESGVTCIFQNSGEECLAASRLIVRLARDMFLTDMMPGFIRRAATPDDIEEAKREGRHCLYPLANAVPMAQEWRSVEEELRFIRVFFELGHRMMHLTYNRRNMIGDGCGEPANAGLSDFGRAVVAEMNRVGVIVDIAHSGWQTSLEAAQVSEAPMVASHSTCCALKKHIRSKPDEVIRAIADTGGYVGICAIPSFLGGAGDISAFLDHLDYAIKTVGTEHVAIGTDYGWSLPQRGDQVAMPPWPKGRKGWAAFWPPESLGGPEWHKPRQLLSLAWINWPLFTVGLVQRGHSDDDIRKVVGGNLLRVARAVLEHAGVARVQLGQSAGNGVCPPARSAT